MTHYVVGRVSNTGLACNIEIAIAQQYAIVLIGVSALWTLTVPQLETALCPLNLPEALAAVSDSAVYRPCEHERAKCT